jgi:AcrR family transcriptional regulator
MPKIVNHELKKIEIAEAAWKIIVQEGLENASVRKIAKETGMSVGSLRHYFPSQSDLLLFSMELVSERVKKRWFAKHIRKGPLETLLELTCEVLPLDEERRVETEVWLVFSTKALVDGQLQQLSRQVFEDLHRGFEMLLRKMHDEGILRDGLRLDLEVKRLHALVDGMAMHHLLHPDKLTAREMEDILLEHMRPLFKSHGEAPSCP